MMYISFILYKYVFFKFRHVAPVSPVSSIQCLTLDETKKGKCIDNKPCRFELDLRSQKILRVSACQQIPMF